MYQIVYYFNYFNYFYCYYYKIINISIYFSFIKIKKKGVVQQKYKKKCSLLFSYFDSKNKIFTIINI